MTIPFEMAEARLEEAERHIQELPAEQARTIQGWALTIRASIALATGKIMHGVSLARQALELLPEAEVLPRLCAMATTSSAYLVSGDVTHATEHEIAAAVAFIRASGRLFPTVSSMALLARLHVLQGRLRQAAATYAQLVQVVPHPEVLQAAFSSLFYYFGLGDLLREWNDLEAAEQHLVQGMALVNETQTVELNAAMLGYTCEWLNLDGRNRKTLELNAAISGYTALARLEQARGNTRAAFATLDVLERLAEQRHFPPHLMTRVAAVRAQLELAQGNVAAAIRWADSSGLSTEVLST